MNQNQIKLQNPVTGPRHGSLTTSKIVRGILCILVLILTAFVLLVYFGFWTAIGLRFFSIHYSRRATSFFFGSWIALWPFLFEKVNKTRVIFSGDFVPERERVIVIANHRTEVDWMYLWDLALRKRCEGYIRYILKSSLMRLPLFGWVFHIMEFIPVARKWEQDESIMRYMLSTFKDPQDPLWLVVFPEGTDFTEQKSIRSQKFAFENGLPILKNVLLPKTKGFLACLQALRDSIDAVYDITIGYKYRCPSFLDNVFGVDPAEVHIHVRRIALTDIPESEEQIASWLMETFNLKDQLLSNFNVTGYFPGEAIERPLNNIKCLLNVIFVILVTGMFTFLTFFSSIWFKIYVSVVCALLGTLTNLSIRPKPLVY